MLYRIGHVRLVESLSRWEVDEGLRSRCLFDMALPPKHMKKVILPLRQKLQGRVWSITQDYFTSRHWDYYTLVGPREKGTGGWVWNPDAIPNQTKLVERLQRLCVVNRQLIQRYDWVYTTATTIPTDLPLSATPLLDEKGKEILWPLVPEDGGGEKGGKEEAPSSPVDETNPTALLSPKGAAGNTTGGGGGSTDAETTSQSKLESLKQLKDEVENVKDYFDDHLSRNEAVVLWEATTDALFTTVVYKHYPREEALGYEKDRKKHVAVYAKMVVAGGDMVEKADEAIQGYLQALREKGTTKRARSLSSSLNDLALAINLPRLLLLLPPTTKVLTLIPSNGLELVPLHALPVVPITTCSSSTTTTTTTTSTTTTLAEDDAILLIDQFDIRYASSLPMLQLSQIQLLDALKTTPWYYSHLCVIEVSVKMID